MAQVLTTKFSTEEVEESEKYDAFRESIGVLFDVEHHPEHSENFEASLISHLLGEIMLVECEAQGQVFSRSQSKIASDGIDHYLIQLFQEGFTQGTQGGHQPRGDQGKIIVLDAGQDWKANNSDFKNLTLIVPRRLLADKLLCEHSHQGRTIDISSPFGRILADYMLALNKTIMEMSAQEAHLLINPSLDLIAATLNQNMATTTKSTDLSQQSLTRALRMRIHRYIDDNLSNQELGVDHLRNAFNLSRSFLYRQFESVGGVASYIRDRRLDMAYKKIWFGKQNIVEICFTLGFKSESSFSRTFKQRFSISPTKLREQKTAKALTNQENKLASGREWEDWVRKL